MVAHVLLYDFICDVIITPFYCVTSGRGSPSSVSRHFRARIAQLEVFHTLLSPFPCPLPNPPFGLSGQLGQGSSL